MGLGGLGYHGRAVLRGGEGWDRIEFPGLVAQRQSGRLITDWSLVRIQAGPPTPVVCAEMRTTVLSLSRSWAAVVNIDVARCRDSKPYWLE